MSPDLILFQWNIYDFINSELIHNRTYAHRLPPTLIEQARHWANYHEAGVFSDPEINAVGNSMSTSFLALLLSID